MTGITCDASVSGNAKVKLGKAKSRITINHPFFASVLLGCPTIITRDLPIPTAATDGVKIYIHPDALDKWMVDEVVGVLAHEVMHIVALHPWRKGSRDHRRANKAMDYAINQILIESGFTLPEDALIDSKYHGQSFETIYPQLADEEGEGEGSDCFDDVMDAPGTEAERQQSEAEAKVRITQAVNLAKAQGCLPGALKDFVEESFKVKVSRLEQLRAYMSAFVKSDTSWNRGQRRFLGQGLYLPARHNPSLGELVIGMDTSGSLVDQAAELLADISLICEECCPEKVTLIQLDSQVQSITEHAYGEQLQVTVSGGGGTDMRKLYPAITSDPSLVILFTDGYTPWGEPPPYRHLTISTGEPCPYGDNIPF